MSIGPGHTASTRSMHTSSVQAASPERILVRLGPSVNVSCKKMGILVETVHRSSNYTSCSEYTAHLEGILVLPAARAVPGVSRVSNPEKLRARKYPQVLTKTSAILRGHEVPAVFSLQNTLFHSPVLGALVQRSTDAPSIAILTA